MTEFKLNVTKFLGLTFSSQEIEMWSIGMDASSRQREGAAVDDWPVLFDISTASKGNMEPWINPY